MPIVERKTFMEKEKRILQADVSELIEILKFNFESPQIHLYILEDYRHYKSK